MIKRKTFIKEVPTLEGTKTYEFKALVRKDAVRVAHNSLRIVIGALSQLSGMMSSTLESKKGVSEAPKKGTEDEEPLAPEGELDSAFVGESVKGITKALYSLNFEVLWELAESLFKDVCIDDEPMIRDINESDYFGDNIDEFYTALACAIEGNYPKVFVKFRGAINGSNLLKKAVSRLKSKGILS